MIISASALAGWAMVHFTARAERHWQERHAEKFGEKPAVPVHPSPWTRFMRSRRV